MEEARSKNRRQVSQHMPRVVMERLKHLALHWSGGISAKQTRRLEGREECETEEGSLGQQGGKKWCAVGWRLGMCSAQIGIEAGGARTSGRGGFGFGGPKRDLALSVAVTRVAPTACPRQLVGDSVLGQQHRCASD
jgi:hypothetical protein